jgi:hypothetical protein
MVYGQCSIPEFSFGNDANAPQMRSIKRADQSIIQIIKLETWIILTPSQFLPGWYAEDHASPDNDVVKIT